jgi:hypothetical protein
MFGNGGYGVAVARELVELSVRVRLPVATPKFRSKQSTQEVAVDLFCLIM